MKNHLYLLLAAMLLVQVVNGQVTNNVELPTSISTDGANPDPSAMLDVRSTTQGMLVPRMTSKQRTAIKTPATSLLVFDTTTNSFWFYNGTAWQNLNATDTDWQSNSDGIYNYSDIVAIGDFPKTDVKLFVEQNTTGAGKAAIAAEHAKQFGAENGGASWKLLEVDAALSGFSVYGNPYTAAVYGSSLHDFSNSASVIGVSQNPITHNVDIYGALGYRDANYSLYAGYFKGDFKVKKALDTDGISIESEDNTNQWLVNINSTHNDFDFRYNSFVRAYISDVDGYYTNTSDRSLKTEVEYLGGILPKITQLKPAKYYYKSATDAPQKSHGFIAQEVQQVFPELVHEREGLLTLAYDNFAILSIQAIKEQQAIIEAQGQENESLKAEVANQNTKIEKQGAKIDALQNQLNEIKAMLSNK